MATKYGTIPTANDSNLGNVVSHAKQRMRSDLGLRRPWKEMVSFSLPENFSEALFRIQTNVSYFHMNYVIMVLFVVFLSLLWHPVSLIVFMVMLFVWLFLYILRDDPIIVFGYVVDDRLVIVVLTIVTIIVLLLTRANVMLLGLMTGMVVVLIHSVFGQTADLILNEETGDQWGATRMHMKETASSSYSSSV